MSSIEEILQSDTEAMTLADPFGREKSVRIHS